MPRRKGGMKKTNVSEIVYLLKLMQIKGRIEGMDVRVTEITNILQIWEILDKYSNKSEKANMSRFRISHLFNLLNTKNMTFMNMNNVYVDYITPELYDFVMNSSLEDWQKQNFAYFTEQLREAKEEEFVIPEDQQLLTATLIGHFTCIILAIIEREPTGKGRKGGIKKQPRLEIEFAMDQGRVDGTYDGKNYIIKRVDNIGRIEKVLNDNANETEKENIARLNINKIFNVWKARNLTVKQFIKEYLPYITTDLSVFVVVYSENINDNEKERFVNTLKRLEKAAESREPLGDEEQSELAHALMINFSIIIYSLMEYDGGIITGRRSKEGVDEGRRGEGMPSDLNISQQIAKQSYNLTDPQKDIDGWMLADWSPNLKIYTKENVGILGVRGTKTMEDVSVWPTVTLNTLGTTDLYKRIEGEFMDFKNKHPEITEYYAVGHSLGGALIDVMLRKGIVKEAVSFNPAIQYNDINGGLPNRRIYYGADPMYKLMGWWDRKSEHRDTDMFSKFISSMVDSPVGNMLSAHKLSNFIGGKKCRKCGLKK